MSRDRAIVPASRTVLCDLLAFWRDRPGVSFSVGVPGVIAEFHAMPGEVTAWTVENRAVHGRCSGGAMRIALRDGTGILPFDLASRRPDRRVRGVLFCLPDGEARMSASAALRRAGGRDGCDLFDIGAGVATVDALVMTDDRGLSATLAGFAGARLVGTHHPALTAIVAASPPRLFRSALAEIVVRQPIATGVTPHGPHTHLLPDLIDGTTHDPRIALPRGWLPCLAMHIPDSDPAFAELPAQLSAPPGGQVARCRPCG